MLIGHGYRARFGVKVPFTVSACCVLPPGGNLATAGEDRWDRCHDFFGLHDIEDEGHTNFTANPLRMGLPAFGTPKMRRNSMRSKPMRVGSCALCPSQMGSA